MNIGIVTTWFERGAAYVSRQYRDVLQKQHRVFIYARGEDDAKQDPAWNTAGVTWGKRRRYGIKTAIDLKDFRRWLEANRIELVIFNEQHWWLPILLCNELGIKTGAYVDYYTEETVSFFACYDFLLCNTRRHYSAFAWHPQCFYIPWGTDLAVFKPQQLEPVAPGSVTFFHSSGLSPKRKGTDLVIDAFADMPSQARLVIHSQRSLKLALPELAEKIQMLESAGRLICRDETVPAPGLYHLGDVYVYPSRLDGIGLTIAEALACGLPVITTDHPPMNEFVEPGINGQLVSVERLIARADGYYWSQALASLPNLRQQMLVYVEHLAELGQFKTRARQYAEEKLNWQRNAECLIEYVDKVRKQSKEQTQTISRSIQEYEEQRTAWAHRHENIFYAATLLYSPLKYFQKLLRSQK